MSTIEDGARLFGYEQRGWTLKPQQIEVGEALDRHAGTTAILMPRRSAKTESVLLWVFAMMEANPGLRVAFTMATTREAARAKFLMDVLPVLETMAEFRDDVRLLKGAGYERADMSGSSFVVLAPSDKAFRSKAFDIIVIDESGEADPDAMDELLTAALPTLDTSDLGMLVLMGTAGDVRDGNLLWDALHDPDASVVDYSAGDAVDVASLTDWDYVEAMLEQYHPGIGTLTTTDKLKRNWARLKPLKFAREYLGLWGDLGNVSGEFGAAEWAALTLDARMPDLMDLPRRKFALAVAATDEHSSIVAAWRVDGEARLLLVDNRDGRAHLPILARDIAKKYTVPVVLDPRASQVMKDVKQRLEQLTPRARVAEQTYEDVAAAHERIALDVRRGIVRHWNQEELTSAFLSVRRQQMGAQWKFGRVDESADITPAQAATLALRFYDAQPRASVGAVQAVAV